MLIWKVLPVIPLCVTHYNHPRLIVSNQIEECISMQRYEPSYIYASPDFSSSSFMENYIGLNRVDSGSLARPK